MKVELFLFITKTIIVVTDLEENPFKFIKTGDYVVVNGDEGYIEII